MVLLNSNDQLPYEVKPEVSEFDSQTDFILNHTDYINQLFEDDTFNNLNGSNDEKNTIDQFIGEKRPVLVTIKGIIRYGRLPEWYIVAKSDLFEYPVKIPIAEFLYSFNENSSYKNKLSQNIVESYLQLLTFYIGYQCNVIFISVNTAYILASRKEYASYIQRGLFFNIDPELRLKKNDSIQAKVIYKNRNIVFLECCGLEIHLKPEKFHPIVFKHLEQNNTVFLKLKHLWADSMSQKINNFRVKPVLSTTDRWLIKIQNLKIGTVLSGRVIKILKNGCIIKTNELKIFATFGKRRSIRVGKKFSLKIKNINFRKHRIYGSLI